MLGGVLLSPGRQLSTILAIVAVPAFVAAASMLAMGRREIVILDQKLEDLAATATR
jgi:hypothetical protein